jgi:hypothetical protein
MSKPSPTSRTLAKLKELGFTADKVERRNPVMRHVTHDYCGFADIVACREGVGILFIQACAGSSHSARRAKIMAEPRAVRVARAGGKIEVWSWAKQGARGERKAWTLRREDLSAELKCDMACLCQWDERE